MPRGLILQAKKNQRISAAIRALPILLFSFLFLACLARLASLARTPAKLSSVYIQEAARDSSPVTRYQHHRSPLSREPRNRNGQGQTGTEPRSQHNSAGSLRRKTTLAALSVLEIVTFTKRVKSQTRDVRTDRSQETFPPLLHLHLQLQTISHT